MAVKFKSSFPPFYSGRNSTVKREPGGSTAWRGWDSRGKTVRRWPMIGRASRLGPLGWLFRQHPEIDVKKIYYKSTYTSFNSILPTHSAACPASFFLSRASICEQNLHCTRHAIFPLSDQASYDSCTFLLIVHICPDAPFPSCSLRDLSPQARPAHF